MMTLLPRRPLSLSRACWNPDPPDVLDSRAPPTACCVAVAIHAMAGGPCKSLAGSAPSTLPLFSSSCVVAAPRGGGGASSFASLKSSLWRVVSCPNCRPVRTQSLPLQFACSPCSMFCLQSHDSWEPSSLVPPMGSSKSKKLMLQEQCIQRVCVSPDPSISQAVALLSC
jgi:hypothetical protein